VWHISLTEMGLGKTYVGSEKMISLRAGVNLIVCQKSKINDWMNHFKEHYPLPVYNLTNKSYFERFFEMTELVDGVVGVINYELAWRRPELLKLQDFTLLLDESSLIQNTKAKQTKFILKMKPANVILLSGTPCSGKYENLYSQIKLLGWDISESTYNKQYINWTTVNFGGLRVRMVDKKNPYKNVDRLKEKLRENGAVFMKTDEVFDLPEQTFITVDVPVTKEYKRFMKDCIIKVDGEELVGDTTLTKRLYARQLCGQYNKEKLQAFKSLVESTNDRLIVFYTYTKELEKMRELVDRPVSIVNGLVKDLGAYEDEDDSITFVQYQAGAKGLNLQKANKMIYFTLTDSIENWMQSAKRINRIGQERPCFYYILQCKDSIEEKVREALERGENFTNELFEEYDQKTRSCGNKTCKA
jgi:hypothetical protein